MVVSFDIFEMKLSRLSFTKKKFELFGVRQNEKAEKKRKSVGSQEMF